RRSARYQIAPFVVVRQAGKTWLVEAPLAHVRVWLVRPDCLAILSRLTTRASLREICRAVPFIDAKTVGRIVAFLASAGVVIDSGDRRSDPWDAWPVEDLL